MTIYTIGHSTRSAENFLDLLRAHAVRQVADIRSIPASRRHPHFAREVMTEWLAAAGVSYRHFPALGGRRRPRPDSINTAVRHAGFRGYADHMATEEFGEGVAALQGFAEAGLTTVMCAEAVWWQCHRRFLADALLVGGVTVLHILSDAPPKSHELSDFGRARNGTVIYPGLL